MTTEEPVVIDGGDKSCVRLLLELRAHLAGLPPGTLVHLLASDPAAPIDLPAWCHLTGHHYEGPVPADTPAYALRVAADARPTRPDAPWRPAAQEF
ncbi:sulfurtransferase TusA family protein [Actinomadura rupiterrae]|uniref:sulfurtransferase TusA family protein n=1 Tax=Actinomadura rupiterrae TaxID=559627 RepID=UPI0020A294E1|nr:sulfurtransferase TusA family protein [Actinomadura rupiterrae]MCP2342762.1 tRNA 2-thiouridine synthesizing protein A [Actinomadura rupiterrae]